MSGERKAWPTGLCQAEPPRRSYSAIRRGSARRSRLFLVIFSKGSVEEFIRHLVRLVGSYRGPAR